MLLEGDEEIGWKQLVLLFCPPRAMLGISYDTTEVKCSDTILETNELEKMQKDNISSQFLNGENYRVFIPNKIQKEAVLYSSAIQKNNHQITNDGYNKM